MRAYVACGNHGKTTINLLLFDEPYDNDMTVHMFFEQHVVLNLLKFHTFQNAFFEKFCKIIKKILYQIDF